MLLLGVSTPEKEKMKHPKRKFSQPKRKYTKIMPFYSRKSGSGDARYPVGQGRQNPAIVG